MLSMLAARVWLPLQAASASMIRCRSANCAGLFNVRNRCDDSDAEVADISSVDADGELVGSGAIFSRGRCSGRISGPSHSATARSMTFLSSRMLPGQR